MAGTILNALAAANSLPLLAKAAIAAAVAAAIVVAFLRLRDNASNRLRKAKMLHEKAIRLHQGGEEEKARLLFEKSGFHRERAFEHMKGKA